jgi:hypothetical protein
MFSFLNENVFDCISSTISGIEDAINGTLQLDSPCRIEDVLVYKEKDHRGNIRNSPYWRKREDE